MVQDEVILLLGSGLSEPSCNAGTVIVV